MAATPATRKLQEGSGQVKPLEDFAFPDATEQAPHVRDTINLSRVQNWMLLALTPSILAGLYNTGFQANLALSEIPGSMQPSGWREQVLAILSQSNSPERAIDCLFHGMLYLLPAFAVSVIFAWFWEILFAKLRNRRTNHGFVATALIFTLLLPPSAPLWQIALGVSFGIILGKEVFGGVGKNCLNPALVGLVFLHLAYSGRLTDNRVWNEIAGYSGTTLFAGIQSTGRQALEQAGVTFGDSLLGLIQGPLGTTSALAAILGGLLLIRVRLACWRTMAGVLLGLIGGLTIFRLLSAESDPLLALEWPWHLTLGSLAFGIVFLAPDPVTSAVTRQGRWVYGMLIGFTVVLIRSKNPLHPDGVILAVLLGNVFAPLLDSFFVWTNVRRRKHALQARSRAD